MSRALSIRQPWAWLIVNGVKDIENRTWPTLVRETIFIHAGKTMTHQEYLECMRYANARGVGIPLEHTLERGGIVGIGRLCGCVKASKSRWFDGPYGFVFRDCQPLRFMACPGQLDFFEVPTLLAR
jgi:hypothetical protein